MSYETVACFRRFSEEMIHSLQEPLYYVAEFTEGIAADEVRMPLTR